jgi:hypothetical protein
MFFSVLRPRAGRLTQNKQCHFRITTIWIWTFSLHICFFQLFQIITLNFVTVLLHWYCSSKTSIDQCEWSIHLVPNKILCKIYLLILILYHWYVTVWWSNAVLIYLHKFCYFLFFVFFFPCWLVGFWIFKLRKTDKKLLLVEALVL